MNYSSELLFSIYKELLMDSSILLFTPGLLYSRVIKQVAIAVVCLAPRACYKLLKLKHARCSRSNYKTVERQKSDFHGQEEISFS